MTRSRPFLLAGLAAVLAIVVGVPTAQAAMPANDDFANATVVSSLPFLDSQDTTNATFEGGEPTPSCALVGGSGIGNTIWYRYAPPSDEVLTATADGSFGGHVLGVWSGTSLGSLTEVACVTGFTEPATITATAGTTYYFQLGGQVEMGTPTSGTAQFSLSITHKLTTATAGFGSGTVGCSPGPCGQDYVDGTSVTLTATPSTNDSFSGWSGDCSGTSTTCHLTMDGDKSATASFDAPTLTVDSTGDGSDATPGDGVCDDGTGHCTLRAAIQEANASGGEHHIHFAIGSGAQTITPASPLPPIETKIDVDGTSQPGYSGAPLIDLRGTNAGAGADGLRICDHGIYTNDCGFRINPGDPPQPADGSEVRGLAIGGWSGSGIYVNSTNVIVADNYVGTDGSGAAADANGTGITLNGSSASTVVGGALDNTIGGAAAGDANVISGNLGAGIVLSVGGSYSLGAANNLISHNLIGVAADGATPLANGGNGIDLTGSSGPNSVTENTIAFDGGAGVALGGVGQQVSQNSIFSNSGLGIDGSGDDSQPAPVLSSATAGSSTAVAGTLAVVPNQTYRIEFYASPACDPSGAGQGKTYLGSTTISPNTSDASFSDSALAASAAGDSITALAIATTTHAGDRVPTAGDTSRFSHCVAAAGPAAQLAFTSPATGVASGSGKALTVEVLDAHGDLEVGDNATSVTFAQTGGAGTVTGAGSSAATAGLATKTVTGVAAGSVTITATAPGLASASTTFTVTPGPADHLTFTSSTADLASGAQRTLTAEVWDANGNLRTNDDSTSVTFTQSSGAGSVTGLGAATAAGGVASKTVTGGELGPVTVTASAGGITGAQTSFAVVGGSTLTISKAGTGSGSVSSSPAGIDCGSTCSHAYAHGASVTLTAAAASGSSFTGWSGACSGTGTCTLTLNADATATATFTANPSAPPPASCVVPKVKGDTLAAAERAISSAHCRTGKVTKVASKTVKSGRVISQKPAPGKHLPNGSPVNLVVSRGKR